MPKVKQTPKTKAAGKKLSQPVSSSSDMRAFKRRSVLWPAHLVVGRHRITCQVWNLSLSGARVRVDLPIKEGTAVVLSIRDRGNINAQVAWVDDQAMGLDFDVATKVVESMFKDRLHVLGLDEKE